MERPMPKPNDLSRSPVALDENTTLIAVIEMGLAGWLVAGRVPGINRSPLRKLDANPEALLARLHRLRDEAIRAGRTITRTAVAYEASRDGFWLARWLRARGVDSYVIHPTSIPVKRDHRRAKTDRLDTALLMRAFLGWLRGEADHCSMAAIPTLEEEDRKRPNREHQKLSGEKTRIISRVKGALARLGIRNFSGNLRYAADRLKQMRTPEGVAIPPNTMAELERDLARLRFIREQSRAIEKTRVTKLTESPHHQPHAMVLMLAQVRGIGIETADMLVNEVLCRDLRDRRAVARYAGMTGSPDESGAKRREQGLAKAGNSRVRRGMLQLAWRWLMFQKDSALSQWYKARTEHAPERTRKTMIVALARKLLIALWRYTTIGEIPEGVVLRSAG
jgi:transposase